ncbi:ATP-binding protein [Halobaculum sp. MBLA0147]|uniref:ATP-binding protein n=1 Tax=Halobaculum sp. MBLA0147 TaxID=3079934 RepID=UPI0035247486
MTVVDPWFSALLLYVVALGGSIAVATGGAVWVYRRGGEAARELTTFLAVVAVWATLQLAEVVGGGETAYVTSYGIEVTRAVMAVAWFYFTLTYAGYRDLLANWSVRTLVGAGFLFTVVVTGFPPVASEVAFRTVRVLEDPIVVVALRGAGPIHLLAQLIGYGFVGTGTLALGARLFRSEAVGRWRAGLFVASAAAVVLSDPAGMDAISPTPGIDTSVVGTTAVAAAFLVVVYGTDTGQFVATARAAVFDEIDDAVLVVSDDHSLVDYNETAAARLPGRFELGESVLETLPPGITTDDHVRTLTPGRTTTTVTRGGAATRGDDESLADDDGEPLAGDDDGEPPASGGGGEPPARGDGGEAVAPDDGGGGSGSVDRAGERHFEVTVSPLTGTGSGEGAALVFRDVTERVADRRRLREQRNTLELLNRTVAHDVRNDLQVVVSRADVLDHQLTETLSEATNEADPRAGDEADTAGGGDSEGDDPEAPVETPRSVLDEAVTHADELRSAARNAVDLTESAREIARATLESDGARVPVPVDRTVTESVQRARATYRDATFRIAEPVPEVEVLAGEMLDAVLRNLLSNAVSHNDRAEPTVEVSVTVEGASVRLRVADDGPGVSAADRDRVFDEGETALDSDGSGLGLYLVQTLVDGYDGRVWVEDNEPRGAVFVVELERAGGAAPVDTDHGGATDDWDAGPEMTGERVDDDPGGETRVDDDTDDPFGGVVDHEE